MIEETEQTTETETETETEITFELNIGAIILLTLAFALMGFILFASY